MSITTGGQRKAGPYSGNGSTTNFPFSFKVFQASDLLVVQTDNSSTPTDTTLALTTHYTVILNANQDSNPGGSVNMVVAPPAGYLLTIGSQIPQIQSVTLTNNGGFYPSVINNALDYLTILIQQVSEKLGRSLSMPFSTSASGQLPPVSPGSLLGWKQDGSGIANVGATGVGAGGIVASNMASGATGAALSSDTQAAAAKATPVDADLIPLHDSASIPAFTLKKFTWANLKTALSSVFLLQNNPTLGLVETFADPAGARCRRYYDITGLTGMLYNGATINAEYMTVNNTSITGGAWAGRDVAGPCWAEVMTDAGQKLFYYAPSAAAGVVPAWYSITPGAGNIMQIAASVASNALTLTLNPIIGLNFRSSTLGTGIPNTRDIPAPLSLVVPSGATLGTINNVLCRLVILAIDNAGTVELAVVNQAGGNNLDETTLINTTAISGTSNSNNVIYSATARTGVPFRVVGYIEAAEATAGTWATAPSLVQGAGGQAGAAMQSIGMGQTWQSVTRTSGTTYYNTTGKPIFLYVVSTSGAIAQTDALTINGLVVNTVIMPAGSAGLLNLAIIPVGASYSHAFTGTSFSAYEMR